MATLRKTDRVKEAIRELQSLIEGRFPEAVFEVVKGWDPPGTYLEVMVPTDDFLRTFHEIMDVVMDRYLELHDEQGLPIYVMPIRPREPVSPVVT